MENEEIYVTVFSKAGPVNLKPFNSSSSFTLRGFHYMFLFKYRNDVFKIWPISKQGIITKKYLAVELSKTSKGLSPMSLLKGIRTQMLV